MKIIELTKQNLSENRVDVIEIIASQMASIGGSTDKARIEKALANALKEESRAKIFLGYIDNELMGMCFLNICSGLESGGDYIYINEINISQQYRKQGYGSTLLSSIKQWAKKNDCKYIAAIAHKRNKASQNLFKRNGFTDSEVTWLDINL